MPTASHRSFVFKLKECNGEKGSHLFISAALSTFHPSPSFSRSIDHVRRISEGRTPHSDITNIVQSAAKQASSSLRAKNEVCNFIFKHQESHPFLRALRLCRFAKLMSEVLWMVRIGGGVFPVIKEPDYLVNGEYRVDKGAAPKMLNCLIHTYIRAAPSVAESGAPPAVEAEASTSAESGVPPRAETGEESSALAIESITLPTSEK
ncbi:hypothetical protein DCAR_0935043 [Daucus carota subsp. sativus]|uniref:Uncharacterized protein n=1 Tax=Daucus carota subsp. sativus TaxID=79200 RepID=A0A175YHF4_DAUCS|nr:hypothetical protein DCAR_0935043 [Daucus carota subsp. sativus]